MESVIVFSQCALKGVSLVKRVLEAIWNRVININYILFIPEMDIILR